MKKYLLPALMVLLLPLAACAPTQSPTPALETPLALATSLPAPTSTPTPRGLTVCLGREPNTLYIYGNPNSAARSVLAAIYDGPVDIISYDYQPVILERRPSFANGDARIANVEVRRGDVIVDANGLLRPLDFGVRVRPAGCNALDCAIEYQGGAINMDQMVVTFTLLPDLTWSDGAPLTAYDSVYAFQLDAHPDTPTSKYLTDRTYTYEAVDTLAVEWWGVPGFIYQDYPSAFWQPLPKHLLEQTAPADLPQDPAASRAPVGWGPYVLREWLPGERIVLDKNPTYFRASEGLPAFDFVTYRFVDSLDQAIADLQTG
ncbi:MAG: ABC transporter substrate-binding protein, partial [Anaerolineales bacterium]